MMTEAVEDLTTTLNEAASAAGVVGGMVDSIMQAINQVRALGTCGQRLPWVRDLGYRRGGLDNFSWTHLLPSAR